MEWIFDMNWREVKRKYRNTNDEKISDFISLCINDSIIYRRGTGFFTSSALKSYSESLIKIIKSDIKIEIICSTKISDDIFINSLEETSSEQQKEKIISKTNQILLDAVDYAKDPKQRDLQGKILSYLLASNKLEVRIGIPNFSDGIYHPKFGYFSYPNGDLVSFEGSFNESHTGHNSSIERARIFRSWSEDLTEQTEAHEIKEEIDKEWNGEADYLDVFQIDQDVVEKIISIAPDKKTIEIDLENYLKKKKADFSLWSHQEKAVNAFLKHESGVLEMATGSGKTTTSLEIARRLIDQDKINSVIITTYGTALLEQWVENVDKWKSKNNVDLIPLRHFDRNRDLVRFLNRPRNRILIVNRSRENLEKIFDSTSIKSNSKNILIIHDEVHKFGAASFTENLKGMHSIFKYKLGLSATPVREYDEGTSFIFSEIGDVVFTYDLKDAIKDNILCEFDYHKIKFEYSDEDKKKIQKIYSNFHNPSPDSKRMTKEDFYRDLSRVRKNAEFKPKKLDEFLSHHPSLVDSSIIFVDNTKQGEAIQKIIKKYTQKYFLFFEGEHPEMLSFLSSGSASTAIACSRLDEGIDIPSLKTIFLVATPRAKLITIQRIGRCLRKDPSNPGKKANVVDFILDKEVDDSEKEYKDADLMRMEWIDDLSKTRNTKTN